MRDWIWKALCAVVLHGAYSNLYLKEHLQQLPEKDRGLATRIFYGTLQNYSLCESMWKPYVSRKVPGKIGVLLSMSCYQLRFLDKVPAYAVIDDAVSLAGRKDTRMSAFVNAVLRKVSQSAMEMPQDELEALALESSLPLWIIRMWNAQYGEKKARQAALSSTKMLPVYVRINPLKMDDKTLHELEEKEILIKDPSGLYRYGGTSLAGDSLLAQGLISAMDPGSYEIARFGHPKAGERILDLCAAPGTKSMAMAEQMHNQGSITACDLHEHRVRLIDQDTKRLGLDIIETHAGDSTRLPETMQEYDLVLCDVPCSGYGVLARKPDMKLKLSPETMDILIPLQAQLLESGANRLAENGRIVYSTCTLNKKENEKQVEAFLRDHPEFELEEQKTIFPDETHDGFYMARLKRLPETPEGSDQQLSAQPRQN